MSSARELKDDPDVHLTQKQTAYNVIADILKKKFGEQLRASITRNRKPVKKKITMVQ